MTASSSSKGLSEQLAFDIDARERPSSDDRTYAAGFFDGEGCVSMTRDSQRNVRARVIVTNTHLPVLEWLRERWGGQIYTHKPGTQRQPAYQWHLQETRIPAFLEDIRPLMKVKAAQTDNALAFMRLRGQRRKHSHLTATEKAAYEEFLANHRALDLTHGGQAAHGPRVVREPGDPQRSTSVG